MYVIVQDLSTSQFMFAYFQAKYNRILLIFITYCLLTTTKKDNKNCERGSQIAMMYRVFTSKGPYVKIRSQPNTVCSDHADEAEYLKIWHPQNKFGFSSGQSGMKDNPGSPISEIFGNRRGVHAYEKLRKCVLSFSVVAYSRIFQTIVY